jgi:hypothetical protein
MTDSTNNGWPKDPSTTRIYVGGDKDGCEVRAGDVETIFESLIRRFHSEVEPIITASGYRSSQVNTQSGGITTSNHLSATAVDLNGYAHPYEANATWSHRFANYRSGFTTAQVSSIRAILGSMGGLVRWGMDFAVGYRDSMHFEIRGSAASVASLASKIRDAASTTEPPAPSTPNTPPEPAKPTTTKDDDMSHFVELLYLAYLNRAANALEVLDWVRSASVSGMDTTTLEREFMKSRAEPGAVLAAYWRFMGRAPESTDVVLSWSDTETIQQVWDGVAGSIEALAHNAK